MSLSPWDPSSLLDYQRWAPLWSQSLSWQGWTTKLPSPHYFLFWDLDGCGCGGCQIKVCPKKHLADLYCKRQVEYHLGKSLNTVYRKCFRFETSLLSVDPLSSEPMVPVSPHLHERSMRDPSSMFYQSIPSIDYSALSVPSLLLLAYWLGF